MKKMSVRVLALCLAVLMLSAALVSCNKQLSGMYENNTFGLTITYTFSGKGYVRTMKGLSEYDAGVSVAGTYRIEDGTIYFTSENGIEESYSFSKSGNTITIAEMEYVKQ